MCNVSVMTFTLLNFILSIDAIERASTYSIWNKTRYDSPFKTLNAASEIGCAVSCDMVLECMSVSFQMSTGTCYHHRLIPGLSETGPSSAEGWQVIYVQLTYALSMAGAVAWQSSAMPYYGGPHVASRGIDGNTNTNLETGGSCFHTYNEWSWWAVELTHIARIAGVLVFFRTDGSYFRTANLRFAVALSRTDFEAGILINVFFYTGPPTASTSNPLNFTFPTWAFGKVMRIQSEQGTYMHLCEVVLLGV